MKPIIGILSEIDDKLNTTVRNFYVRAIEENGGIPILLPYVKGEDCFDYFVNECDGFFFTGGVDIEPKRYKEDKKQTCGDNQLYRDEQEFRLFDKIILTNKPILGVCRGAQLINVALGGTLHQDIPSEIDTKILHRQEEGEREFSHSVNVLTGTPLSDLIKCEKIKANSFHHQAVKTLGKGLKIMAKADDGIIEGFYLDGKRYIRAYQWHPERLWDKDEANALIFEDFMNACK